MWRPSVVAAVGFPELAALEVSKRVSPDRDAFAERDRIGVRRDLVGTREGMKSSEDDLRSTCTVPGRELVRTLGEGQMDGDADDRRQRIARRGTCKEILVPVLDRPRLRGARRDARQGETRGQNVLAEARVRVLRIERIDQERVAWGGRCGTEVVVESRRVAHGIGEEHGGLLGRGIYLF